MSQSKAEILAPVGIFTASGINATGVVTASSFEGNGENLEGVGIGTTGSINSVGIITAGSFFGVGTGLTGITLIGPTNSLETTGIITASSFFGDGSGIVNIGGSLAPLSYQPSIGATNVGIGTNIVLTFNKPIASAAATTGVGTISLREVSADGTLVESFDIFNSSGLTISGSVLTIDPTSNLSGFTTYFVVIPTGTLQDTIDSSDNIDISTYSFQTTSQEFKLFLSGVASQGALGQNDTTQRSSPTQIPGTTWGTISQCYNTSFATKTDGTLWAWGSNDNGEMGNNLSGANSRFSSPVQIPGTTWEKELPTNGHSATGACFKTDGSLWMWGSNNSGQFGVNDTVQRSSPVQVPGTQWVSTGMNGSVTHISGSGFTKTDGTLWTWGGNGSGQLGHGDKTAKSSPRQIPGTYWTNFQGGYYNGFCFKTDGSLWVWGNGGYGKLGLNFTTERSSPIQLPGTGWSIGRGKLSGYYASGAIKTDGTLWMWGRGDDGQMGENNRINRSSPRQVPGTQWVQISIGTRREVMARKSDNTMWAWGYNIQGDLGLNDAQSRSSPTQVSGTQWEIAFGGYQNAGGIKKE